MWSLKSFASQSRWWFVYEKYWTCLHNVHNILKYPWTSGSVHTFVQRRFQSCCGLHFCLSHSAASCILLVNKTCTGLSGIQITGLIQAIVNLGALWQNRLQCIHFHCMYASELHFLGQTHNIWHLWDPSTSSFKLTWPRCSLVFKIMHKTNFISWFYHNVGPKVKVHLIVRAVQGYDFTLILHQHCNCSCLTTRCCTHVQDTFTWLRIWNINQHCHQGILCRISEPVSPVNTLVLS